nr:SpaA isopeptide-forming pilin-related protein [Lentilactobacillus dabitei]
MTIQFKEGYELDGPLIVQYYTEIQKTVGADFENKVTLSLGEKKFTQGTVLESGIEAWGSIKHFSVNVIKRDDITGDPLEGVEFKLQQMDKDGHWQDVMTTVDQGDAKPEVYKLRTGANGMATFMDLTAFGKYRIVETEGLSGRFEQYESKLFTMNDVDEGKAVYVLEVTNPYDGDLIIKKGVNSNGLETSKDEFNFEVKAVSDLEAVNKDFVGSFEYAVYDKSGDPVNGRDDQPIKGTVTFEDGIAIGLPAIKDDQQLKIFGLPQNQHFMIKELNAERYNTTHRLINTSNGSSGRLRGKETSLFKLQEGEKTDSTVASFTNSIVPGEFAFSKTIKGPNVANDKDRKQFNFYLEAINEDGDPDETFTGDIEGWKHAGGSDTKVTFHFVSGKANQITINGSREAIQLRHGEGYNKIQLPKNMQFKVYERQDDTYKYTKYWIDGDYGEAPSGSDKDGDYHYVGPINTDGKHLKFINEQKGNSFEFEKRVSGTMPNDLTKFDFTVEGVGNTVASIKNKEFKAVVKNARSGDVINDTGKITFNGDGVASEINYGGYDPTKIQLTHGQKLVILGLPENATHFKVIETTAGDSETYTQVDNGSRQEGKEAEIELNQPNVQDLILFENVNNGHIPLTIKKTLSGVVPPKHTEFTFEVVIKDPGKEWGESKEFNAIMSDRDEEFKLEFKKDSDDYKTTIKLEADQSITIYLPKGLTVETTETTKGYEVSHQYGKHEDEGNSHKVVLENNDCDEPCLPPLIFNNHVPGTIVEIEKKVKGTPLANADYGRQFQFGIVAKDENGQGITTGDDETEDNDVEADKKGFAYEISNATGQTVSSGRVEFKDGKISRIDDEEFSAESPGYFELKHDQKLKILGLPDGAKVVVTELNPAGYVPEWSVGKGSTMSGNETSEFVTNEKTPSTVKFTNTKKTSSLHLSKTLVGDGITTDDKAKEFEFKITAEDPEKVASKYQAAKRNTDGTITKLPVSFNTDGEYKINLQGTEALTIDGLPLDVTFNVEEMEAEMLENEGFQISHALNTVPQNSHKTANFKLHGEMTPVEFVNAKHKPDTGFLQMKKELAGSGITEADENQIFEFQVRSAISGEFKATKFTQSGAVQSLDVQLTNGMSNTISLKSKERLIISGLPLNTDFSVTELGAANFKTNWMVNGITTHEGKQTELFRILNQQTTPVLLTNSKQAPDTASLKISKTLAGEGITDADSNQDFNFRIYSSASGIYKAVKVQQKGNTTNTTVTIQDGESGLITLKNGETLTLAGLPIDHNYAVGEAYVNGYVTSYKVNGTPEVKGMTTDPFRLVANQNGTVDFTNTKNGDVAMGSFSVNKFVNQTGNRTRAFEFNLEAVDGAGNPLNGIFQTETITNGGTVAKGRIDIQGGNAKFTLTHGQSIKFILPMGARYEVSEKDYKVDGYTTRVTKRDAAYTGTHVFGTATADSDNISYHNDFEEDEGELPLPADEDKPDSSATIDEPDALPASDGTSGTNGTSGITSPQGLPSAGYTGKQALPQTGEDDGRLYTIIGVIILVMVAVVVTIYYTKRKQTK